MAPSFMSDITRVVLRNQSSPPQSASQYNLRSERTWCVPSMSDVKSRVSALTAANRSTDEDAAIHVHRTERWTAIRSEMALT